MHIANRRIFGIITFKVFNSYNFEGGMSNEKEPTRKKKNKKKTCFIFFSRQSKKNRPRTRRSIIKVDLIIKLLSCFNDGFI